MNQHTTFHSPGSTTPPWTQAEPPFAPRARSETDPRALLDEGELAEADRLGYPVVASQVARRDFLGLAAGLAIALGLGFVTFSTLNSSRHDEFAAGSNEPQAVQSPPAAETQAVAADPSQLLAPTQMAPTAPLEPTTQIASAPPMAPMQSVGVPPIVIFDGSTPAGSSQEGDPAGSMAPPKLLSGGTSSSGQEAPSAAAHSVKLAEPSMTVIQGTLIPAVLETALDSDVPGFARAVVTQDIRSFDRSKILIPRSSRLIGEYKAASGQGQRRIHLMWTRLIRPDGVSIALASPATDAAGRAGVTGKVNSHFFERLGSALLTSVIGAVNPLARGGATVVVAGGDSVANAAVPGLSQRPSTIRVRQGEPVRVFAARDLVFASTDGGGQ